MKKITLSEATSVLSKSKKIPNPSSVKNFSLTDALDVANQLEIDFNKVQFTPDEFLEGLNIELEHGMSNPNTNVSNNDLLTTGKIALAHLNETHLYYNNDIGIEAFEHALKDFKGNPTGKKIQIL